MGVCYLYASSPFALGSSSSLLDSQLQHVTSPWNSSIGAAAAGSLAAAIILLKMEPMAPCLYFIRKRNPFFEAMHKDFVSIHFVREDREERIGRLVYKAPYLIEGRPIYERAEHRVY